MSVCVIVYGAFLIWSRVASGWLVGVELTREWSWVEWMKGRYGRCEFVLGGERGVWRVVRMRYVGKTWCCMGIGWGYVE